MVNWNDPARLLNDYISFIKLSHVIAGVYIWEIVFTAGFEWDVFRRKRPYRWSIWLYLGTRYTLLLTFILLFVDMDGPRIPCQPMIIAINALIYAAWASGSLIIVLRVIAIWSRNIVVSLIAVGVWLGGVALGIRHLATIPGTVAFNPLADTCIILHTHKTIVDSIGILVIDVVLLLTMLIGLLRHAHRSSTGIWKLLYQQCIIWLALAMIAEIPPLVFLILNLNDIWNEILIVPSSTVLSIGASRIYRSLSNHGSLTEYASSDPLQFSSKASNLAQCRGANIPGTMHFASATLSEGTGTTYELPVFLPADPIHMGFVRGGSISSLPRVITKEKVTDNQVMVACESESV